MRSFLRWTRLVFAACLLILMVASGCGREPDSAAAANATPGGGPIRVPVKGLDGVVALINTPVDGLRVEVAKPKGKVKPGDVLEVRAVMVNGFVPEDGVNFSCNGDFLHVEQPPYIAQLTVAKEHVGDVRLSVWGYDKDRHIAASPIVVLPGGIDATLMRLIADIDLLVVHVGYSQPIYLKGEFSDGIIRIVITSRA